MEFVGRVKELELLESVYRKDPIKTCMMCGRRRIGKTALIERFISDKPSIFIQFDDSKGNANLDAIDAALSVRTGEIVRSASMRESMDRIKEICSREKTVIAFDELPFLTSNVPEGASEIQHLTDWIVRNTDSMVIVAGSSVSLMLEEVLGSDKPLYKRFMSRIDLGPLQIEDTRRIHPSVSDGDLLRTYLTLGGISAYHRQVGDAPYRDIMNRHVLSGFGFMQPDVQVGIFQEFGRDAPKASSILRSVSGGQDTYGTIKGYTGFVDRELQDMLDRMMASGFLAKSDSMVSSKKSKMYSIADPITSFQYDVIDRNRSILESDTGDPYSALEPIVSAWLGKRFEVYCRNLVRRAYPCSEAGSWWGKAPMVKDGRKVIGDDGKPVLEDTDVDVVAVIRKGNAHLDLFGECEFKSAPMGMSALDKLRARVEHIGSRNPVLALFSPSGFSDDLAEHSADNGVLLFDLDVLVGRKAPPAIRCGRSRRSVRQNNIEHLRWSPGGWRRLAPRKSGAGRTHPPADGSHRLAHGDGDQRNTIHNPFTEADPMTEKLRVGILGATGMVGQRFVSLLADHPWFEIAVLAASARSAGKTYEEALAGRWSIETPLPEKVRGMVVRNVSEVDGICKDVDFVFSAVDMPKEEIRAMEDDYARHERPVVSNNSAHRWTPDVPMILPEINPHHVEVIAAQKKRLGTERGFIAVKPNCSIQSYTPVLEAWKEFEPYEVIVTTYQAISGAGKNFDSWPEMVGNIIPFISGEEEKSEKEPMRIWGRVENGEIVPADTPVITSQCIRVPVLYGHTAAVFVKLRKPATKEQLIAAMERFSGEPQDLGLPSAPKQFIRYLEEDNRPQVLMDVDYERGMGVTVGRLRQDTVYDWKFVGLSHNTLRGAAGGAVLCAELLTAKGLISKAE